MKRIILLPTVLTIVLGVLIAACTPLPAVPVLISAPSDKAAASELYWPEQMGTHPTVNMHHDHECVSPSECVFIGTFSIPNIAIGNATLSMERIDGLDVLKVDGIDSTLTNGVMQRLPETKVMHTYLMLPNFSLSQGGATLKTTQFGIVDGKPDQEFSSLWIMNVGDRLRIVGDWSPVGAQSYEIQIYEGTELVTAQKGLETGEMFLPLGDILGEDCEIKPPHKVTGEVPEPAAFTIPGRGTFVGDNFAILPENDDHEPTAQTRIEMLAKDTGPLYLVQQYAAGGPQVDKR